MRSSGGAFVAWVGGCAMNWINLFIPSAIRAPEFVGSSVAERGTWLSVLAYACELECGGVLRGAADWKDRQWQQSCGVTLREVRAASRLLRFVGQDLVVNGYPVAKEASVRQARGVGKAGAMARWGNRQARADAGRHQNGMSSGNAKPMPGGNAEGEGEVEGEGEGASACRLPDHEDLFGATPPLAKELTDEALIEPLRSVAVWHTSDPERTCDNAALLAGLVRRHGGEAVHKTAVQIQAATGKRAWSDRIEAALVERTHADAVAALPDDPHDWTRKVGGAS